MVQNRVIQEQYVSTDIKQQRPSKKCLKEFCIHNQCCAEHRIRKCVNFANLNENLVRCCLDLAEAGASDSLSIICKAAFPFDVPPNLMSSKMELLFKNLKPCRGRTSDPGDFATACMSAALSKNVITNSAGQFTSDTIEEKEKVRNLLKSPLFCHLGDLDRRLGRKKSLCTKDAKWSDLISIFSDVSISSPLKTLIGDVALVKKPCGSKITKKMLATSSISKSSSPCQSTSNACAITHKGLIHCMWRSGIPYFVFYLDDQGEVFVANRYKVDSRDDKTLDYIYVIQSRAEGQKEQGSHGDNVSGLIGKMLVSSSLSPTNLQVRETEFVLFGTKENLVKEMQNSNPAHRKSKKLSTKVLNIFGTNPPKHMTATKFGHPSFIFDTFSQEPSVDTLHMPNRLNRDTHLLNRPSPNLELAAIVVKDYCHDSSQDRATGGWGLNFLNKATVQCTDRSLNPCGSCGGGCLMNKNEGLMSMNVLVPSGFHGGPMTKNGGPSSLTQRWRSSGHCDCGGWDIGCPLKVLSTESSKMESFPNVDAWDYCKSFDLFVEGAKQGSPTLKMLKTHDSVYYIHFQSTLSALQSFSIGMAIIHAQTSAFRSTLSGS